MHIWREGVQVFLEGQLVVITYCRREKIHWTFSWSNWWDFLTFLVTIMVHRALCARLCAAVSITSCLTSKDTAALHPIYFLEAQTLHRFRHVHTETRSSVTPIFSSCLSHSRRHMHGSYAQATHRLPRLAHTLIRARVQRTIQKLLSVFGWSVITGAEKAMCLRWQVHSGVSSFSTTRLQNNITLSSGAHTHTDKLTHIHTTALLSNTQN